MMAESCSRSAPEMKYPLAKDHPDKMQTSVDTIETWFGENGARIRIFDRYRPSGRLRNRSTTPSALLPSDAQRRRSASRTEVESVTGVATFPALTGPAPPPDIATGRPTSSAETSCPS